MPAIRPPTHPGRVVPDPRVHQGVARQLAERARRIARGEGPVGWKAGFGSKSSLANFGLDGPLVGFLTSASIVASGAGASIAGWSRPVAEPELAVFLGSGLSGESDERTIRNAISWIVPAIELADVNPPPEDVEEILAGNIFHRSVIVGDWDRNRPGADLEGLRAVVTVNGQLVADTSDLEVLTGKVPAVIASLAAQLGAHGVRLQRDEFVICGSIIPPISIGRGDRVVFELQPLKPISVDVR